MTNMKVLLIESDHKVAHTLKKALEQEGFAVDIAYDSTEGDDKAVNKAYDLVIIDRTISGKDNGLGVAKAMRNANIHTPVLLTGTSGSVQDRKAEREAGIDSVIAKPFSVSDVLTHSRALLQYPEGQPSAILKARDLSLDTAARTVTRAGKSIHLTSKEFALLEYLLRHQGQPLSKDDIISHIWHYESDVLPNTVEVYIKYLRQKIDDPFDKPLLKTSRGFGYRIQP